MMVEELHLIIGTLNNPEEKYNSLMKAIKEKIHVIKLEVIGLSTI